MVPATATPVTIASWLTVASTPLKDAARAAGTPAAVRCASTSNPMPCAAPAITSNAVACHGQPPALVSQESRPQVVANAANAASGRRGCQPAGNLVQVTEAAANPAAYPAKVSPDASGLCLKACCR